jgi:hypothetical protein
MNKRFVMQSDGTMIISIPGKDKAAAPRKAKLVRQADPDMTPSILEGKKTSSGKKPWTRVPLQPCDITTALKTGCGLKPKSAKTYFKNLRSVRQICGGHSVVDLLKNIDTTLGTVEAAVRRFKLSPWTHAAYLSSVLSVIRHTVACETKSKPGFRAAREKLQAAHRKAHLLASQPALQNGSMQIRHHVGQWLARSQLSCTTALICTHPHIVWGALYPSNDKPHGLGSAVGLQLSCWSNVSTQSQPHVLLATKKR